MACLAGILKQYNWLSDIFESSVETSIRASTASVGAPSPFGYVPITIKANPKAGSTARGYGDDMMRRRWSLAIAGFILILAGGALAYFTQTAGGIRIEDVRFKGAKGNTMSALLYIPPNATAQTPAPGILAVHGYINSRETQDGFAIEFARRGYV